MGAPEDVSNHLHNYHLHRETDRAMAELMGRQARQPDLPGLDKPGPGCGVLPEISKVDPVAVGGAAQVVSPPLALL